MQIKKVTKYIFWSLLVIVLVTSLAYNAYILYMWRSNVLRQQGYNQAIQMIDFNLKKEGKVILNKAGENGEVTSITLVQEPAAK